MRQSSIREAVATVTVSEPVRATRKAPRVGPRNGNVHTEEVHPDAMAAARAAVREGERLVIVSPTRVDIVND